jgi:ABC-type hemin transport system ATPase subunit
VPHDYPEDYVATAKEVIEVVDRALPAKTVIRSRKGFKMFCDQLIIMQQGRIVASGAPQDVLSEDLLRDVFSVEARIEASPYHARPHIHYLR